jgi:hypothetical protein
MPTATDLVTDLPADFEVFGQAVATSMADLLGGTTGQVLAKNSNTDMDFVWVAQDDSNAIQNTIVDAKGDLIAASAADTPARLAVGNNGETLVADSSTSTGLRYQTPKTQNAVYNSGFDVWQRGTSSTANSTAAGNGYTADRWQSIYTSASMTTSQQATGDTTNLPNIRYCARVQRDSGQTSTQNVVLVQTLETADSRRFAGQTITFSYYARKGSNFSAASSVLNAVVNQGTGTDQNAIWNFTSSSNVSASTATLTTTWQRFQATATVAAGSTEVGFYFYYTPVGTAGANDYFEITGIQLETGSVATPFNRMSGTIQGELAACQRYFYKSPELSVVPGAATSSGLIRGGTNASGNRWIGAFCLPVTMRVNPTCVVYNPNNGTAGQMRNEDANTNVTVSGIFGQYTNTVTQIDFSPVTSANNVVVGYITASAEL